MTRTSRDILIGMEALLATPQAWTKFNLAKDVEGDECSPIDPHAACFCMLGAKNRVLGPKQVLADVPLDREVKLKLSAAAVTRFPTRAEGKGPGQRVSSFNDDPLTTHADVLDVIRLAQRI